MKIYTIIYLLTLALSSCAKSPSLEPTHEPDPEQLKDTVSLAQLNELISLANFGDTVYIEPAVYIINGKINMVPGVTLKGLTSTKPIFDATSKGSELFEILYNSEEVNNCTFKNIAFYNIKMKFSPTTDYAIKNVVFDDCLFDFGKRKPGTDEKSYTNDAYIIFVKIEYSAIKNCTFLRREGNDGRGIQNKYTRNTIIEYNNWGGSDPELTGYFVTAINERGTNTFIRHNTIAKHPTWAPLEKQDHGIYALDFNRVNITSNTISGWPPNGSGGSIKARNGENIIIENNTFETSGILLYVYETSKIQQHLKNVVIKDNKIDIIGGDSSASIYNGIGYWTDTDYRNEFSIRIEGNTIKNGYCIAKTGRINVDGFNANGGGFYNNTCLEIHIISDISHSGNTAKIVEY
jgi:hypothetical protein